MSLWLSTGVKPAPAANMIGVGVLRRINDLLERLSGRRLTQGGSALAQRWQIGDLQTRAVYSAIGQLHMRDLLDVDNDRVDLRTAELKVFSQNGEDGVIHALMKLLSLQSGFFVEFGVGDGSECNTRLLAEVFGWSGVYLEPGTEFSDLAVRHQVTERVSCMQVAVTSTNVNELFATACVPSRFGVLSVDVDGQDYWIWDAMSEMYQPDVVVIEVNTSRPRGSMAVEPRGRPWSKDYTSSFGASVDAYRDLARKKGYELVHVEQCGINAFFVRIESLRERRVAGVCDRSPNYYLQGKGHPDAAGGALGADAEPE